MSEPTKRDILFEHYTRDEIRERAAETLVVVPVGATEQHGPHLPVGTDKFAVEYVARAAAERVADRVPVLVTPTLPFGSSHHHLPFSGTISLSTETYYRVVREIVESLITDGFRNIIIVNGHGGNQELIRLVARDLALIHPVAIGAGAYWDIAQAALADTEPGKRGLLPGHAGMFESSLMLALRPELIRHELPERDDPAVGSRPPSQAIRREVHGAWQAMDGYSDSPARATAEDGQRYAHLIVNAVAEAFVAFMEAGRPA